MSVYTAGSSSGVQECIGEGEIDVKVVYNGVIMSAAWHIGFSVIKPG